MVAFGRDDRCSVWQLHLRYCQRRKRIAHHQCSCMYSIRAREESWNTCTHGYLGVSSHEHLVLACIRTPPVHVKEDLDGSVVCAAELPALDVRTWFPCRFSKTMITSPKITTKQNTAEQTVLSHCVSTALSCVCYYESLWAGQFALLLGRSRRTT